MILDEAFTAEYEHSNSTFKIRIRTKKTIELNKNLAINME
jgi:hypothetical protein